MDSRLKVLLAAGTVIVMVLVGLWLQPDIERRLAPELLQAWVAIESEGSDIAEVGPVEFEAGSKFRLHAVLEARDRRGNPVYYTEATRLSFAGEEVPAASLRPWDRPIEARVRWFTVEGRRPYVALAPGAEVTLELEELLRSDWPTAWNVPGEIEAAYDDQLEVAGALDSRQYFGILRYQVRVELWGEEDKLVPGQTFASWGAEELRAEIERFPTARVLLAGPLREVSQVFGLTQLEPAAGAPGEQLTEVARLADLGLAFSRATLLRDLLEDTGKRIDELDWRWTDLSGDSTWGTSLAVGDLLRVGERIVVLYQDAGLAGVLDYQDLAFDFVDGARIRPLSEIFSGEGESVELANLAD